MSVPRWSQVEDDLLREHFRSNRDCTELIPCRTKDAIKSRARTLGLTQPDTPWTAALVRRVSRMAAHYTDEEIASAVGRTVAAVRDKISGLRRPPRMRFPSAAPIASDIRERCYAERISLQKLYRFIGTDRFLAERRIRRYNAIHPALSDAVRILGGELYVEWED